jgi:hypothetical protein
MPRYRNTGKVARARIVPPSQISLLPSDEPATQLASIVVAGATTERYNRIWHVGRTRIDNGVLFGRLGYESTAAADLWDEERKDFHETSTPSGVVSPFAISLRSFLLVFQTRSSDIQVTSFTGALQGILRDASGQDWNIRPARQEMSYRQWRSTVDRVTQMRFTVEPPNPNYQDRPDIEKLIEGARLSSAELVLKSDQSIYTDADIVLQLLDHVENRGYGKDVFVGERTVSGEVVESVYSSEMHGETEVVVLAANPDTGEVEQEALLHELERIEGIIESNG